MSNYQIIHTDHKTEENLIFFGEKSKYIRIDQVSHEVAKVLKENSEGNTWFTKEIDMKQDKTRFDLLPEPAKRAFKLNIAYQTLMDSGVTSGISEVMLKCVTSPIWDILYRRIMIEETIHSESYSYGLLEVFGSEASKILDLVYDDPVVQARMDVEKDMFKSLHDLTDLDDIPYHDPLTMRKLRKALLQLLMGVYCLEGIKFPFSFLVTFTINDKYENAIPGFTRTIQLIAHDELNTHVPTTRHLFAIFKTEEHQGFKEFFDNKFFYEELDRIIKITVDSEIEWAKYLLSEGDVKSLSFDTCEYFIKWRANFMYQILGLDDNPYKDYIPNSTTEFFENYRAINKHNAALQETDNTSYQKGQLKYDWNRFDNEEEEDEY